MSEPHEGPPAEDAAGTQPPVPPAQAPSGWGAGYGQPPGYGAPAQSGAPGQHQGPPPQGPPAYGQPQQGSGQQGSGQQPQQVPGQYGQPQYGQPQQGPGQYGQPQYGQPQHGPGQYGQPQYGSGHGPAGGYLPPPTQRGIVPLRPLGLGEIFDGAFRAIRANPRVMFGFSALVVSVAVALGALIQWLIIPSIAGAASRLTSGLDPSGMVADSYAVSLSTLGMVPLIGLATVLLTGLLTGSVSRSVIGQTISVGELWQRHRRRVLVLLGFTLLSQLAVLVAWGLLIVAVALLATADQLGAALLVGVLGGLGLLVASVWFGIRILLIPPALILEGTSITEALRHGWRLTYGSFWRLLGIYLLTQVILGVIAQIVVTPLTMIAMFAFPDPTSGGPIALTAVGLAVSYTITTVVTASVVALLYIDTRIRREGLDVELARAAEAAAGADTALGARR